MLIWAETRLATAKNETAIDTNFFTFIVIVPPEIALSK
jgi:hypothetical protein